MGMEDFWEQLPTGKEDKPLLFEMGPLEYDFHDIDGLYFMLDRRLSGCLLMMWAKPMNPDIQGTVTLDSRVVSGCINQYMEVMGNMWVLGIPLRGLVTEYGREYQLHVEGFVDMDGNEMNPQDFTVRGVEKVKPKPEDAAHEQIALEAAREGIVLLKNEAEVLPLKKGTVLNLFGRGIHEFRIGAVGAGKINPRYSVNFVEAVREGEAYSLNEELVEFYGCDRDEIPGDEMLMRAKKLSDTAIVFLTRAAGENQDASTAKGEYYLSEAEEALIAKVTDTFAKTIVILNVGYPIDVTFAEKYAVAGLIYSGFGGMLAGPALLDILSGAVNPSGKLPDTWAKDYFDIPSSKNFYDCVDKTRLTADENIYVDTCYEEDIYVGYRYFTTFRKKAAYILSKGYYRIYVGNSIEAAECGGFDEEETRIIKQVTNLLCCDCKFTRLSKTNPDDTWPTGAHSGVVKNKLTFLPYEKRKHYPAKFDMEKPKEKVTFDAVRKNPSRAAEFVAQMSPEELARISVCASAGWGMEGIGEAGRVFQTEGYDLPDFPVSDGNSGVNLNIKNIGMPSGVTICASFNKELSEAIGCVIGEEAKTLGMPLVLAPAFNIHRNPLNGRQPEYFSEDPYLSGVMAGFYAKGLEGAGVGGCYKHFIGNNCESSRKRNQSLISERAIREIYFRTFEYAMDVHMPASFMTAYNAVNGCPTAADEELLQGLLREENGFAGFVMTDWTTYDSVDVAAMVQAGNCWITPGSNDDTYTGQIKKGLENGTIDTARLQENVTALIRTMAKFS